ncbi:MAG: PD40 domain-containing protein [Candidatus Solibacter usitatus]|nr:PD40 domain-containing protein [Candidatus Solibacter usitatus]
MGLSAAFPRPWTRRALLSFLAASGLDAGSPKPRTFPADWRRYPDGATELDVLRLTDFSYASFLPAYYNRALTRRGQILFYSSHRTGAAQAFRMNLRSGESAQLSDIPALDGATLTLTPDERSLCFFDGPSLRYVALAKMRDRVVYSVPDGWKRTAGASVTGDGDSALFAETRDGGSRLRLVGLVKSAAAVILEARGEISHAVARPGRNQLMYRQADGSIWVVQYDGRENRRLKTPAGALGPAHWAPDGSAVLYLHFPEDRRQLNTIRAYTLDDDRDALVAKTSQFVHFGVNRDGSVFAGASRNAASPHLLLSLRANKRELTLCEHRASDPAAVAPIFSADSQSVFFQSDLHGKPAIYRVRVEQFVEKTEPGGL